MGFVLKNFKNDLKVTRLANVHYFEFTPNYHTVNDSHEFCELIYVDKGSVEISSDGYTGILQQNEMILHGANQNHSLTCSEKIAPNLIIIGFECNSDSLDALMYAPLRLGEDLQKMLAEIIKEARTVYLPPYGVPNVKDMKKRKAFSFGADQLIKDYLQIFLIKCVRLTTQPIKHVQKPVAVENTRIYEVKRYLDENYRHRIAIEELCFLFNTNKTTLSAAFKQAFDKTIIEHVNTLRIEYTKELLREGEHTLTQIADLLHVSSVHYLTTLFKKLTAMTPTEYLHTIQKSLQIQE
ncbi:MAG: helix-turn-helix transcriptional regulator [Clostridia bacterium]|nr:helix-turn-helix transcriptional regulator [Clostridia bacterium]